MKRDPLLPSVEVLNHIQGEWMKLNTDAPKPERDRVLTLMKQIPHTYISSNPDKTAGVVMHHGTPLSAGPLPMHQCLDLVRRQGGRLDAVWMGDHWEGQ